MSTESTMTSPRPLSLILIAAVTKKNGLGTKGTLPWKLPKEMAHFRKATSATGSGSNSSSSASNSASSPMNAVVMGRKTWESIPTKFRPLKGRINVVISRSTGKEAEQSLGIDGTEHAYLVSSLESAVDLLHKSSSNLARTFLIGGAQLYSQAMKETPPNAVLDRLLITRIFEPSFDECDVFLPEFKSKDQVAEDQEGGRGRSQAQTGEWRRSEAGELGSFIGEEVDDGVIEEKGVRYQLQMWQR